MLGSCGVPDALAQWGARGAASGPTATGRSNRFASGRPQEAQNLTMTCALMVRGAPGVILLLLSAV